MSTTTIHTAPSHRTGFGSAALWIAIVALVAAVAGLLTTAADVWLGPTYTGPTAVVRIDTTAKTAGGLVRPLEVRPDAASLVVTPPVPLPVEFADQPAGHLQRGPVL